MTKEEREWIGTMLSKLAEQSKNLANVLYRANPTDFSYSLMEKIERLRGEIDNLAQEGPKEPVHEVPFRVRE